MENQRYEYDIKAKSFAYTVKVMRFFRYLYKERYYRFMLDQLHRAVSSVSANIEEAQNSSSKKELARYYQIALKSGRETIHWIKLLRETVDENKEKIDALIPEMTKLTNILATCVIKLQAKNNN